MIKTSIARKLQNLPVGHSDRIMFLRLPIQDNNLPLFPVYTHLLCRLKLEKRRPSTAICITSCIIIIIIIITIIIIYPLTARVVGAPQMISQPVSSIFSCSPLPSWIWRTPGLSIPCCCLPTSSSVCLVFFPLSLCLVRWFWPHLMNGRHDHTAAVFVSLQWSESLRVDRFKATWSHPCSKHWHLLDYVLTRHRDTRDLLHTRVMPSADYYRDHRLLRASRLCLQVSSQEEWSPDEETASAQTS